MPWTNPTTWNVNDPVPSATLNTDLRDNPLFLKENIALGAFVEQTVALGEITKTKALHTVDTQDDDPTDDLDTINGGTEGDILVLKAEHTDRTIVVKNGAGNIDCDADITLDETNKFVVLVYDGTNWQLLAKRA